MELLLSLLPAPGKGTAIVYCFSQKDTHKISDSLVPSLRPLIISTDINACVISALLGVGHERMSVCMCVCVYVCMCVALPEHIRA